MANLEECPYCDRTGLKGKRGLLGHVRFAHPERYDKFSDSGSTEKYTSNDEKEEKTKGNVIGKSDKCKEIKKEVAKWHQRLRKKVLKKMKRIKHRTRD